MPPLATLLLEDLVAVALVGSHSSSAPPPSLLRFRRGDLRLCMEVYL